MSQKFPTDEEFAALMDGLAAGDDLAARRLLHWYGPTLLFRVRLLLRKYHVLRTQFDSTWFVNGICADLFCHHAKRRRFKSPAKFVRYLFKTAKNTIRKAFAMYVMADKRDLRRDRHLSDPSTTDAAVSLADKHPTPAEIAESQCKWEKWLFSFSFKEQQILLLLRAGYTQREIAEELECCGRTIERHFAHIRSIPSPS